MSEGGRGYRGEGSKSSTGSAANQGPAYLPAGDPDADRDWARRRIGMILRKAQPGGDEQVVPADEPTPAVAAKVDDGKIHLAGKDPLRSSTRDALGRGPEVSGMRVGNAQQARVTKPPQHHLFPQNAADKAWFAERGIDVDNYCVNLPQSDHELVHDVHDWNAQVMSILRRQERQQKRKLSAAEMLVAIQPLMAAAKIAGLPIVRYGSPRPDEGKK